MDNKPSDAMNEALHQACKRGDAAAVETILRQSPQSAYAKARDGQTALHFAVSHGHAYVTRLLIEAGADVNARNRVGLSPLHLAVDGQDPRAIVSTLLAHGADVLARDNAAYTPLHYAATHVDRPDTRDVLEMLLDAGADVDAQTQKGETVLHLAAQALVHQEGGEDAVRLLTSRGARTDTRDHAGKHPIDHRPGNGAVAELLALPEAVPGLKKRSALRGVGARPRGGGARARRTAEVDPEEIQEALHPSDEG